MTTTAVKPHYGLREAVWVKVNGCWVGGKIVHITKPGMPHATYTVDLDHPLYDAKERERITAIGVGKEDLRVPTF